MTNRHYKNYCYDEYMLTRHSQRHLTWIDLVSPTPGEVRSLMEEFDLDPGIAQELLMPSFRSKVDRRGESIFLIFHFPLARNTERPEQEIDFVIGKHFLITTRYDASDPLHSFSTAFDANTVLGRVTASHGGHLFVAMMQALYHSLIDHTEILDRKLDDIEENIFKGDERRMVAEISRVGRTIHDFRRALLPHKEMLLSLEPVAGRFFGSEFGYHVQSVLGVYSRVERDLLSVREALIELRETNNSLLTTKQNEIMKNLTIMAFVTFPLALVSSIFGMNTAWLPFMGMVGDFWVVIGIMATLTVIFFLYFRHKKWL